MRHPHPFIYWLVFGIPIVIGLLLGARVWTRADPNTSLALLATKSLGVALVPLLFILVYLMAFSSATYYLWTYRVGNRVRITGGDHEGKVAVVTKHHRLFAFGCVHVWIEDDRVDIKIPDYQVRKIGLWSFLF